MLPGSSTRTPISSCRICATRCRRLRLRHLDSRGDGGAARSSRIRVAPEILDAVDAASPKRLACGTAVVGDISNTLVTFEPLARSPLAGVVFYELIRLQRRRIPTAFVDAARGRLRRRSSPTDRVRAEPGGARAVFGRAAGVSRDPRSASIATPFAPCSVHLAESAEEVEFIRTGGGPWRALLEEVGAWDPAWVPPGGQPGAVSRRERVSRRARARGARRADDGRRSRASRGARPTLVTCPRSNGHTGAGAPPIEEFYASGVRVAVGTDSLASAPDLNVFAELATMRALAPAVPAATLLDSATRQGARALGFDADYGTHRAGQARAAAGRRRSRRRPTMWKNIWCRESQPEQIRWIGMSEAIGIN